MPVRLGEGGGNGPHPRAIPLSLSRILPRTQQVGPPEVEQVGPSEAWIVALENSP